MAKRNIKEFEKTKNFEYILNEVVYVLLNRKIYEATRTLSISYLNSTFALGMLFKNSS